MKIYFFYSIHKFNSKNKYIFFIINYLFNFNSKKYFWINKKNFVFNFIIYILNF